MKRLLLVRHGQSTWNAEQRWQGHADPPLSPLGERQATVAAAAAAALEPTRVVTSDLTRARQTAERLAPPALEPIVNGSVRERDVGEWTGLTTSEIDERFPGYREAYKAPPGLEDDKSLLARVLPALRAISADLDDGTVCIIVTHGGVIRTVERLLGVASAAIPNLAGRWVHASDGEFALGDREVLIDPDDATLTIPQEE
jgi:broad specificity phosphatase PhoE